jgi:ParB family chromosome partitioning protein
MADAQGSHAPLQPAEEGVGDAFLQQQPRARAAHLSLVEPDGVDHALDRAVDVGIVEHDEGRLAAKLQRQRLARSRRLGADQPAHLRRAGEGDLVHARMLHQQRARAAVAGHHVEHARRQPGLRRQLGEQQRRERGELGRLQHHRVAERQRRCNLPGQHQQREVPRDDLPDHADRQLVGQRALLQLRPAGVMVEVARRQRHVDVARLPDRLAVIERLQHGEEPPVPLDHARERIEMPRPRLPPKLPPRTLRLARGRHRGAHIGLVALRDLRQQRPCRRLHRIEIHPARGLHESAADEMAKSSIMPLQPVPRLAIGLRRRPVVHRLEIPRHAHRFIRSFIAP